jgi:hypothetical protein
MRETVATTRIEPAGADSVSLAWRIAYYGANAAPGLIIAADFAMRAFDFAGPSNIGVAVDKIVSGDALTMRSMVLCYSSNLVKPRTRTAEGPSPRSLAVWSLPPPSGMRGARHHSPVGYPMNRANP